MNKSYTSRFYKMKFYASKQNKILKLIFSPFQEAKLNKIFKV